MAGGDVLAIESLSVDFRTAAGRLHALRDVSLSVPRGEIVGIVGESGCGKSTLINAVHRPARRQCRDRRRQHPLQRRRPPAHAADELRRLRGDRITTVFQDPMTALNPVISIGTQMTEIQYRSGRERVARSADAPSSSWRR